MAIGYANFRSYTAPDSFEPIVSRAHVISTLGGKMRGGGDPRGGAGVGYAW